MLGPYINHAQEEKDWKDSKTEDGITISYRWLNDPKYTDTREMKVVFDIRASVKRIIEHFKDADKLGNWFLLCEQCSIELITDNTWQTYMVFDLPWPYKSKDLVTRNQCLFTNHSVIIKSESSPNSIKPFPGRNRILGYQAQWTFVPASDQLTRVTYTTITYDKTEIPRFLSDPLLQNSFIKSIQHLRRQTR